MRTTTTSPKVHYGKRVTMETSGRACSTTIKSHELVGMKMKQSEGSALESGFRRVDFSDKKREEAYRKINKMLGGN